MGRHRPRLEVVLVVMISLGLTPIMLWAGVNDVIPLPRQIKRLDGTLTLGSDRPLHDGSPAERCSSCKLAIGQLTGDLKSLGVALKRGASDAAPTLYVGCPSERPELAERCRKAKAMPDPKWGPEGYRLKITPTTILIACNSQAGCFYGIQTLRQMLEPGPNGKGATLECADVSDWPAMKWRGTMFPLQSPDEHARLAHYKMNLVNWEVNDGPDYRTIPEFAGGTPLSHYREAAASARRHFIHLTLETQSFGHVGWMLTKFPKLRALPDDTHVLRPLHEPTYELIGRIYAELCPLYDAPVYHAGCDEAWGIEQWAEKQGLDCDEVIGKHLQRLADLLGKHGKRTMIWGDYLLKHRAAIKWMNPKNYIICDWHYSPETRVDRVLSLLGLKREPRAETVPVKPGPYFQTESNASKVPPPHSRREGWCHFPRQGGAASWSFRFRRAGRYRVLALLRHSTGIWQNNQFVKGGRNAAYVGRYGWKLDGEPIKEHWIGEELNPDADEALRWAVLADKHFNAGTHTLSAYVTGMNHAIVAEFVFTQDSQFVPETKRSDIKMR